MAADEQKVVAVDALYYLLERQVNVKYHSILLATCIIPFLPAL